MKIDENEDTCIICLESVHSCIESNILCNFCKCMICSSCNEQYLSYNYNKCTICRTNLNVLIVNMNNTQANNTLHGIPQPVHNQLKKNIFGLFLFTLFIYLSYVIGTYISGSTGSSWIFVNIVVGCITISVISIFFLNFVRLCFTLCRR